jgi:hypothetical protein
MHPEALFKTAKTEQFRGLRAGQAWNLAGSLVGIDMDETYFQRMRNGTSKNLYNLGSRGLSATPGVFTTR